MLSFVGKRFNRALENNRNLIRVNSVLTTIIDILIVICSQNHWNYGLEAGALKGRWVTGNGNAAQELAGTGLWCFELGAEEAAKDEDEEEATATRSQEGHMVRVVGGLMWV